MSVTQGPSGMYVYLKLFYLDEAPDAANWSQTENNQLSSTEDPKHFISKFRSIFHHKENDEYNNTTNQT